MISSEDIIYTGPHKNKKLEGLGGDSGVGQASEFPTKPLLVKKDKVESSSSFSAGPVAHQPHIHPQRRPRLWGAPARATRGKLLGTFLMLFALGGFLITYGPIVRVELGFRLNQFLGLDRQARGSFGNIVGNTLLGDIEGVPDPAFSLVIPKIHAKSKVVSDVDPIDYRAYMEALKIGVAHTKGTKLPGETGNIYLFAHSTDDPTNVIRYNAVFYLLRELDSGDDVLMYYNGVKHRYRVTDTKIVEATDVSYLTPVNSENKEQLILQTCYPPGTTWKRLLVFAEKIALPANEPTPAQ